MYRSEIDSITANESKFSPDFAVMLHYEVLADTDESVAVWKKVNLQPLSPLPCFDNVAEQEAIRKRFGRLCLF